MMNDCLDKTKKQILGNFLANLAGISNKEYQKRVWIEGSGPEVDDFDETTCNFFQEGNDIIQNYKDYGLSENQHHLLLKFRNEFDTFCNGLALEYYLPEVFINTPEWTKITEMAKEVLNAFHFYISKKT